MNQQEIDAAQRAISRDLIQKLFDREIRIRQELSAYIEGRNHKVDIFFYANGTWEYAE